MPREPIAPRRPGSMAEARTKQPPTCQGPDSRCLPRGPVLRRPAGCRKGAQSRPGQARSQVPIRPRSRHTGDPPGTGGRGSPRGGARGWSAHPVRGHRQISDRFRARNGRGLSAGSRDRRGRRRVGSGMPYLKHGGIVVPVPYCCLTGPNAHRLDLNEAEQGERWVLAGNADWARSSASYLPRSGSYASGKSLYGVQVVAGSNPAGPTKFIRVSSAPCSPGW